MSVCEPSGVGTPKESRVLRIEIEPVALTRMLILQSSVNIIEAKLGNQMELESYT
jgi:hypothetical protein